METAFQGSYRRARAELGVMSFGMQVLDLPPNLTNYPTHDHSADGQEEVYIVLSGSGAVEIDGERIPLDQDTMVRIASGTPRRLITGERAMRVLALGGVPGKPYVPPEVSRLGSPDPMAG
jgi:mannose-6-phosphate isomerase-like protein (cupin superfamily)